MKLKALEKQVKPVVRLIAKTKVQNLTTLSMLFVRVRIVTTRQKKADTKSENSLLEILLKKTLQNTQESGCFSQNSSVDFDSFGT